MPAQHLHKLWPLAALLIVSGAPALAQWKGEGIVPGSTHRVNGAVWRDAIQRLPGRQCREQTAGEVVPCEHVRLLVLSESRVPLLCELGFGRDPAQADGGSSAAFFSVVHPGEQRDSGFWAGKPLSQASGVSSRCVAVPSEVPPEPAQGSCVMTLTLAQEADNYYPPGGKRRVEQGVAYFDFDFGHDSARPGNFTMVRSSGFSDLDNAALKLLSSAKASVEGCVEGRARRAVSFEMPEEAQSEPPGDMPAAPGAVIRVTAVRGMLVD